MRKIIYSNPLKFAAFILCALSVAISAYLFTTNFMKEDSIYLFEQSYEDSYMARNDVDEEFYSLARRLESTLDDDGKLQPEKLKNFPYDNDWEYYVKVNDKVYSNVENQTYEDFEDSPMSKGIRVKKSEKTRDGFTNYGMNANYGYYFLKTEKDSYEICVRMPQAVIEKNADEWNVIKANADNSVKAIIALIAFSAALFIYLLCVTGKKKNRGEQEIQLMLIDKMFVEITAALFLFTLIGGGFAIVCLVGYFLIEEYVYIANSIGAAAVFVWASLSMLFLLSLVRNLKNGTFIQRSLIVRICRWIWKTAKSIVRFILKTLKKILNGTKGILLETKQTMHTVSAENFGGRFVGIMMIAFAIAVFILTVLTLAAPVFVIFLIAFVVAAVVFVSKQLIGFERIKEGIEKIKNGDLNHKITDCPEGVIGTMADNINSIGEGLQKSLEREVKAERMKSELITNVSHDLKTPLTSIINYADLLSKENLTPPEANDYAAIIKQKSERLKQLTNDLFDISKVQSGNEEFNIEDIDICLLIHQAMAELNEAIKNSGLVFKVTASDKEVLVKADGRKMSRVFENLFVNCVKYAMKNTRVYIDILKEDNAVMVEIKNIAGYEMDFNADEIAERFVRGDSARSTEGSGLGLAIVKSYVEGCGGSVDIKKDGDLFKVIIHFLK